MRNFLGSLLGRSTAEASASDLAGNHATHQVNASAAPMLQTAVVVNDDHAQLSSEMLGFYLRGIFQNDEDYRWALAKFATVSASDTLEKLDNKLGAFFSQISRPAAGQASDADFRRATAVFAHMEQVAKNRRAYCVDGRTNPNAVFWPDPRSTERPRSLFTELPFAKRFPILDKHTRIVSAGSCFATEVAHSLQRDGYNYLVKELNQGRPGSYEFVDPGTAGLPNASAAWGIIFNTPSFRQLAEKAFNIRALPKILWTLEMFGKNRYLDPFRENIAFDSIGAYEANYEEHISAVREAFLEMDVFIITLGLNEVWYFKADGSVFSRSPWRTAPTIVGYKILTVEENLNDLLRMAEILRYFNPNVKFICTVSPVALHATFRGDEQHVVTANAHSKAVLRVAAEAFQQRCKDVYYFPSYEVVTTSTESPWDVDQRHVSKDAVAKVMSLFHEMYDKN